MTEKSQIQSVVQLAAQAAAAYKWAEAVAFYSEALAQPGLPSETEYSLHDGRAIAYRYLGDFKAEQADLEALTRLAESLADPARQVTALTRQVEALRELGELAAAQAQAKAALALAAGDPPLEAASRRALGFALESQGDFAAARQTYEQALALYRDLGNARGEAYSLTDLAWVDLRTTGRLGGAPALLERALAVFRQLGDRAGEALALNYLGHSSLDAARQRTYYQQALEIYQELNARERQAVMANNLGLLYWRLGIYGRANDYAAQAVQAAREMHAQRALTIFLDGLGRSYLGLGQLNQAEQTFQEWLDLARQIGSRIDEAVAPLGLGWVALAHGQFQMAADFFQTAADLLTEVGVLAELKATALAWLGAVHLAQGQPEVALPYTSQAAAILAGGEVASFEFLEQEVWWWHYKAKGGRMKDEERDISSLIPHPSSFLDRACQTMLAFVATVSDEGLRRNYLNKIAINREITLEWTRQANRRGLSLAPFSERDTSSSNIHDQLQRMLDIGVRLSQERDPDKLPQFIIDEFVELCGAERALLLLADSTEGTLTISLTNNLTAEETAQAQVLAQPLLERLRRTRQAILEEALGEIPPDDVPELHRHSAVAVPLVSQGKLLGALYGDMRHIFGRFNATDLELLTVLANQSAAALENANWTRILEQRVEQRTAELKAANARLEQRNAELSIINSVGEAMAKQLDVKTVTRIVGDKVRDIFQVEVTDIYLFDAHTNLIHPLYTYDLGYTKNDKPFSLGGGLTSIIIQSHQPLVLGTLQQQVELGATFLPDATGGEGLTESYLGVPIIVGDKVLGTVSVQSYQPHAYDENSVRLLSTLSANMGVAIENARLFEETKRLLEEMQQRSAELATVNTVSQALAAELELDGLIKLIGEQMRQTFAADIIYVALLDQQTGLINFPYVYGEEWGPMPLGEGLTSKIIETAAPLLINEDVDTRTAEIGASIVGVEVQSYLGVPITVGKQAIGVISVQSITQEERFEQADLNLLNTIAANVGAALQNARLYRETQRRAEEMAAMAEVSRDISATLDLPTVLERIAAHARLLLAADTSAVFLRETDGQTFQAIVAQGLYADEIKTDFIRLGEGIIGDLAQRGQAEVLNDVWRDPRAVVVPGTPGQVETEKLMVAPLLAGQEVSGMMAVWRYGPGQVFTQADLNFLSGLAQQTAIAIENARLYTVAQEARLTAEATSRELAQTLDDLQATQHQLVEAEKMAALGGLVAGVAHEINTPVGVGVTAASLLEEKTLLFRQTYQSGQMKRSDLEKYLDTAGQSSSMILKNLQRAAELIQSFKQVAVDQSSEERRVFAVKAYLDEILLSLHPKLKRTQLAIEVHADHNLILDSYPGSFAQIVTNLVMNSLAHAYEPGEPGRLAFDLKQKNGRFIFEYSDDGRGIPKEDLGKIFDPFFTTKRGQGGSGLGLHVVYNLVTQKLGGMIRCESEVGIGTKFMIEVPVLDEI
jgi:GAF domain-containing protein/tetratricopeptide (TPR) repeat protein/two-component sensor histidine kinase